MAETEETEPPTVAERDRLLGASESSAPLPEGWHRFDRELATCAFAEGVRWRGSDFWTKGADVDVGAVR